MDDTQDPKDRQDYREPFLLLSIDEHPTCFETCPYATTIRGYSKHFESIIVIALTCKRWGCRYCGVKKSRSLAIRTAAARPNKLITLTVNPKCYITPREAFEETRRKLSELARVVRKQTGEFEYLRVLEITKKGWPHYHLVARSPYIKQKWIADVWNELTGAPIVDIRAIKKAEHVVPYVMKYLCKQTYIPWTNRRISWSKSFFPKEDPPEKGRWQIVSKTWVDDHPSIVIHSNFLGSVFTKVAADAWIVDMPEKSIEGEGLPPSSTPGTLKFP